MSGGNETFKCPCCGREYCFEYSNDLYESVTPFLVDDNGRIDYVQPPDCPGLETLISEAWPVLFGHERFGRRPTSWDEIKSLQDAGYGRAA